MSGTLQIIIFHLIELANAEPNKWKSKRLAKGMSIHIMNDVTAYKLALSRTDTHPSEREWDTILKYWPYPIGGKFDYDFKNGRYFLKGRIPRQETFA